MKFLAIGKATVARNFCGITSVKRGQSNKFLAIGKALVARNFCGITSVKRGH
ncbi:MAG: hypothetical protein GXP61_05295 [Epsilonproteobacteria bacterium]|nr:hypothetical protein [Campylobacterota bacterium]